jgi:regulator of nonsense transcripts 1
MLNGARIVLSTLSTLSNPGLDQVGIFSLVPVERLVVDEASQINAFDFMV